MSAVMVEAVLKLAQLTCSKFDHNGLIAYSFTQAGMQEFTQAVLQLVAVQAPVVIQESGKSPPSWEPKFDCMSAKQEELVNRFCAEIAGPRGKPGRPPDPVALLEMAQALYEAERDDSLQGIFGSHTKVKSHAY